MNDARPAGARAAALAWLAHPVGLAGIAVLLLNDHVLKAAFGTWWTGKLSDVAGLVFAPALVALLAAVIAPRASAATVARGAIVGVGLVFVFVKATAVGAAAASAAWTAVTEPAFGTASVVRHDATDLLALPALALAWWAFTRAREAREPGRLARALRAAVVIPVAMFAVAATSPPLPSFVTGVAVDDGTLLVAWSSQGSGERWAASDDGSHFAWVRLKEAPELTSEACVPSSPSVCYRVTSFTGRIERSVDGGGTWARDWDDWPGPIDRDWAGPDAVASLAVFEDDDGYRVFVASYGERVGVRASDGTWHLVGPEGAADGELAPPRLPSPSFFSFAYSLALGACAALLALLVLSLVARISGRWRFARVAAIVSVTIGLLLALILTALTAPEVPTSWDWTYDGLSQTAGGVFAMVGALVAIILTTLGMWTAIPVDGRDTVSVGVSAALVGLVAGLARVVSLPTDVPSSARLPVVAGAFVIALAVAVAFGVRRERRHRAEAAASA